MSNQSNNQSDSRSDNLELRLDPSVDRVRPCRLCRWIALPLPLNGGEQAPGLPPPPCCIHPELAYSMEIDPVLGPPHVRHYRVAEGPPTPIWDPDGDLVGVVPGPPAMEYVRCPGPPCLLVNHDGLCPRWTPSPRPSDLPAILRLGLLRSPCPPTPSTP